MAGPGTTKEASCAEGGDYETKAGTLTFLPGDTTKTITVNFFASGTQHTNCYRDWSSDVCSSDLISDNSGLGTITNDDTVTLAIDDVAHNEGNAGTTDYTFTVTKIGRASCRERV